MLVPSQGKGEGFEATYLVQSSLKEPVIGENEKKVMVDVQPSCDNFAILHST